MTYVPLRSITLTNNCTFSTQAAEFVEIIGGKSSIYGYHPDTIHSLILTLLPPIGFNYEERFKAVERETQNIKSYFLENLLNALSENAGFNIPVVSPISIHVYNAGC